MKLRIATLLAILAIVSLAWGITLCPETGEVIPEHVLSDPGYWDQSETTEIPNRDVNSWSGTGPWGGNIRAIVTDPANPLHVFAASGLNLATLVGGVYSSQDGGLTWMPTTLQGKPYYALAASPSETGTFYAGARNGLYKTTDNGVTWNAAGLSTTYILSLGVKPNNGSTIIVGKSGNVGIVVSTDGGNNFAQVGVNGGFMRQFAYSAANPERMFIVMGSSSSSVLTSVNNGLTWTSYGPAGDGWGMYTSPTDSLFSLVAHANGIYRSTDGGANWTLTTNGTFRSVVEFNGTFFATSNAGGVLESNDAGLTWQPYNVGVVQSTWQAGASSSAGALLGHWGGIFRADGYQTPIHVSHTGINAAFVHGLAYYADTNELWAGSEGSGIYRSTDNGATWEHMVNGLNNWMIYELVPTNHFYYQSGRMLAGTLNGVYTSLDGGNSWSFVDYAANQVSALEVHPTDPDQFWIGTSTGEIKYTADGGQTWTVATGGMFGFAPRLKLGKGPTGNLRLFLSYQGSATAVWYSDDLGATFSPSTGLDGTTYQPMVAIKPQTSNQAQIIYASTDLGIYKSTDNGATYTATGMTGFSWSAICSPGQQVISGKDNGLSYSTDDAQTSSSLSQNLSNTTTWQLAWGQSTNQVFISTKGRGVMENRFSETVYSHPNTLNAEPGDQQMTLTWIPLGGQIVPSVYWIWRDGYPVAQVNASESSWTDTGLTNGQAYKYFISAVYDGGIHTAPTQIITATPAIPVFLPPTGLTATVITNDVNLNWESPVDSSGDRYLTGYKVFREGQQIATISGTMVHSFDDLDLANGAYLYGVSATYSNGESEQAFTTATVDYVDADDPTAPVVVTELRKNYPNPFTENTTILYTLKDAQSVSIAVYNTKGELVRNLLNETKGSGDHRVVWDGTDAQGNKVGSGIYYYKMKAGSYSGKGKMILMK